jgi:hypothetical protein
MKTNKHDVSVDLFLREVLECTNLLALFVARLAVKKRQKAAAIQDAAAQFSSLVNYPQIFCA